MITPLFAVSNAVLFPKTPMQLHVFDVRQQAMVRDAIAKNRELTVVLVRDAIDPEYACVENVHEIACLGRIESCEELDDGDYDIFIVGLRRVRIDRETQRYPYLMAEVVDESDSDISEHSNGLTARHNRISGLFARFLELTTDSDQKPAGIMPQMDFESLINTVAVSLNVSCEQKQGFLETDDLFERCDLMSAILQQQIETLDIIRKFEHLKPDNPHFN